MTIATVTPHALLDRIDYDAVLRTLKLDPNQPESQALLLVCERYGLDPLLKHLVLIQGRPYVTRDGYLAVAHRSGLFDGMEVLEQGETDSHFVAKVSVYRKDMSRPFTYVGRYAKSSGDMAKKFGPEMAVKVAEVQALRRAFNVTGVSAADELEAAPAWESDPVHLQVEPDAELALTKRNLGDAIQVVADEDQRSRLIDYLRERFGTARTMTLEQAQEALEIAEYWPTSPAQASAVASTVAEIEVDGEAF